MEIKVFDSNEQHLSTDTAEFYFTCSEATINNSRRKKGKEIGFRLVCTVIGIALE